MTEDDPRTPEILSAAAEDANRTLEMKSRGAGYFQVVSMEVQWYQYDSDLDDVVATGKPIIYVP